jgi:hypothetical protein
VTQEKSQTLTRISQSTEFRPRSDRNAKQRPSKRKRQSEPLAQEGPPTATPDAECAGVGYHGVLSNSSSRKVIIISTLACLIGSLHNLT